jgi:TPP-dependent pyruvate/acetoin dehydrogenase alpha subunit
LNNIDLACEQQMEEAVYYADNSPLPELNDLYTDVYDDYPLSMMKRGTNMSI